MLKKFNRSFTLINIRNKLSSYRILFFGNDDVSIECLKSLHNEKLKNPALIENISVLTTPLENRKSAQKDFHTFIDEKKIKKHYVYPKDLKESWKRFYPDFDKEIYNIGIVASFGKMIPSKLINKFEKGCFVMHPSILPKYRGACPIQHAILNKETKTGISIIEASKKKFDQGHIIKQSVIDINPNHRFKELAKILSELGGKEMLNFLYNYDELIKHKIEQTDQNEFPAPLITERQFVYLDFSNSSSDSILQLYKAFYGSQLEPYTKIILFGNERLVFFDDLANANPSQLETLNCIENISRSGSFYWDLNIDRHSIYIKSTTGWLVSNTIKLDKHSFLPAEKVIVELFKNKRFINQKTSLAINSQPK